MNEKIKRLYEAPTLALYEVNLRATILQTSAELPGPLTPNSIQSNGFQSYDF